MSKLDYANTKNEEDSIIPNIFDKALEKDELKYIITAYIDENKLNYKDILKDLKKYVPVLLEKINFEDSEENRKMLASALIKKKSQFVNKNLKVSKKLIDAQKTLDEMLSNYGDDFVNGNAKIQGEDTYSDFRY